MSEIYDAIREAIDESDLSRYAISKETEIDQGQLANFMQGKAGLSVDSLERLTDCLGLEIIIRPKRRRKGR